MLMPVFKASFQSLLREPNTCVRRTMLSIPQRGRRIRNYHRRLFSIPVKGIIFTVMKSA